MTAGIKLIQRCIILVGALLLGGCSREVVRPLQVSPTSSPEIVIFHHITNRTAPLVYVLDLNDDAAERWENLTKGDTIILNSGQDFKASRGHLINGDAVINPDDLFEVKGFLELSAKAAVIELEIRPATSRRIVNHPIDGKYNLTDANTVTVITAEVNER